MARNPQFGRREAQAVQSLFTARSWPARITAVVVLAVFAWGWWQHGNVAVAPGAMVAGQTLDGEIIAVADGDTVTLLDADKHQYKLRLAYIDAPEKSQAFGMAAKQALSDRIYRKTAHADVIDVDRYQRGVAVLSVGDEAINYTQVASGLAWHYQRYAQGKQSADEFNRYEVAEQAARASQLGLWADARPTPPWDYRRAKREVE